MSVCCHRCGEELTAPKFHNRHPYGYSCYEVVAGKSSKDKRKFVKADKVLTDIPEKGAFPLRLQYQGKTFYLGATFRDTEGLLHNSLAEFGENGEVFMMTHDRKGNPVWKNLP